MMLKSLISFLFLGIVNGDEYYEGEWRKTLDICWTDRSCDRVMNVVHGGDWNLEYPYDSFPAFKNANDKGADAVKGDFRVSKDNIGVVMHSSPVEVYESFDCFNKKVEEMTAAECSACHMIYTNYTFSPVPEVLSWAQDTINFMFCVKETHDIARAITTLIENNATHRAFLEISVSEMLDVVVAENLEGWESVYYVINMHTPEELNRILSSSSDILKRTFLFEFNEWEKWPDLSENIALAKEAGIRTFAATKDNGLTATVQNHLDIYHAGFDVVYTYNLDNAIVARIEVNTANGISPP